MPESLLATQTMPLWVLITLILLGCLVGFLITLLVELVVGWPKTKIYNYNLPPSAVEAIRQCEKRLEEQVRQENERQAGKTVVSAGRASTTIAPPLPGTRRGR